MNKWIVTKDNVAPAREDGTCFYCMQPIGQKHKQECVSVHKKVLIELKINLEMEWPAGWDKAQVEYRMNEHTYCMDNIIDQLQQKSQEDGCVCSIISAKYLNDIVT